MNPKKEKDTKPSLLTISITIMNHVDFFFFFWGLLGASNWDIDAEHY